MAMRNTLSMPSDFFHHIPDQEEHGRGPPVRLATGEIQCEPVVFVGEKDEDTEQERHSDPDASENQPLPECDDVRRAVEHAQI